MRPSLRLPLSVLLSAALVACGGAVDPSGEETATDVATGTETADASDRYAFPSRYDAAVSSVSYEGQAFRWLLMSDLGACIDGLGARLDAGTLTPAAGEVLAALKFYYAFDDASSVGVPVALTTTPGLKLTSYEAYPSRKNLHDKLAGNDAVGARKDWSTSFVGFAAHTSPESLLLAWMQAIDDQSVAWFNGTTPKGPDGMALSGPQLTAEGLHLGEGIEKLLLGALAFSQAADDYLDDDLPGEGLNAAHARVEGKPYTQLEHHWDEGFGYFGAARDLLAYTDEELAKAGGRDAYKAGYHDTDGDGAIDLLSEYNFAFAGYAAKRDLASVDGARTDFSHEAMQAFVDGRAVLAAAPEGELTAADRAALLGARDRAVAAWEASIAATVVSYLNRVVGHMDKAAAADATYDFEAHAKHWTEMKALSLAFQFNPRSRVSDADFGTLQTLLGERPVVSGATELAAARQELLEARTLLGTAFAFDARNLAAW